MSMIAPHEKPSWMNSYVFTASKLAVGGIRLSGILEEMQKRPLPSSLLKIAGIHLSGTKDVR